MSLLRMPDLLGRLNLPLGRLRLESSSYDVSASDSQSIPNSWGDTPDMSITFYCDRPAKYLILSSVRMNYVTYYTSGPYRCWTRLNVDTVAREAWSHQCFQGDLGRRVSCLKHTIEEFDAGSHTVKMQWQAEGTSGGQGHQRRLTLIRVD
jgi:hypothetical protein